LSSDDPHPTPPSKPPLGGLTRSFGWLLLLVTLLLLPLLMVTHLGDSGGTYEVSYSRFKSFVGKGDVKEVWLRGDEVRAELRAPQAVGPDGAKGDHIRTRIPAIGDDTLLPLLDEKGVDVNVEAMKSTSSWTVTLLMALPLLLLFGFLFWSFRSARDIAGGIASRGRASFMKQSEMVEFPKTRFTDVAGQENAKREVAELVEFLREPARFQRLGAEVPRGVLLMGAPGTGKTLLARALAGEAKVAFFSISASQFIEVFVGVGASRVRELFETAKKNAPSILFIDELDSIGRTRGTGLGGGHDEREQTLNQILAEMDGFAEHEAVIVLAATNRPDVLDPALLRPGRFDRHVVLDLPDKRDRAAILKVHTRKVPLDGRVDLERIAAGTPGFSGADLKNLVNEAALLAAREGAEAVGEVHLELARDKLLLGTERTLAIQPDEKHRLAIHESGHTLVAYFLENTDPLHKVSIIPRGRALGGTQQLPETERYTLPQEYVEDRLAVTLGGRAAEKEFLGSVSSGADDDIRQATELARAMVGRWGMSEEVGPVDLRDSEEHPFLGREIAQPRRYSESSARAVDEAVRGILLAAETRATDVIREHRKALERLAEQLERAETLEREQIDEILGAKLSIRGTAGA
jgi:cell division protease FtsH